MPNKEKLVAIANALDVSMESLSSSIASTRVELIQSILWWDLLNEQEDIFDCVEDWQKMKWKRDSGEIIDEEYLI